MNDDVPKEDLMFNYLRIIGRLFFWNLKEKVIQYSNRQKDSLHETKGSSSI